MSRFKFWGLTALGAASGHAAVPCRLAAIYPLLKRLVLVEGALNPPPHVLFV